VGVENIETEDGDKIGALQAFHGVGTRGLCRTIIVVRFIIGCVNRYTNQRWLVYRCDSLFYSYAVHRDGLVVRLSGCHCPFCVRGFRMNGIGSMPIGCLSDESYLYTVCNRLDDEWTKQTADLMSILSDSLRGQVQQGDIIAVASSCHLKGSINSIYNSYDIAKVTHVEDSAFIANIFTSVYQSKTPDKLVSISHTSLRYLIPNACLTADLCITLDSVTQENVDKSCSNGTANI
jgi:hypothetical protein